MGAIFCSWWLKRKKQFFKIRKQGRKKMKKIIFCLIISLIIFSVFTPNANAETSRRFRSEALVNLPLLPAYFFFEVFLHESSHALSGLALGGELYTFHPYPGYVNQDGGRGLMFGYVQILWQEDDIPNNRQLAMHCLAPYLTDMILFISSDLMLNYSSSVRESFIGPVLYLAGMVFPAIYTIFNLFGTSEHTDFAMAANFLGERRELFYTVGTMLACIALWRIVQTGIRVLTVEEGARDGQRERRRNRRRINYQIVPTAGGVSFSMTM